MATVPLAYADDRPDITVAVQQIVNDGALKVLREKSNVAARVFHSIFETLIDYERQAADLPQSLRLPLARAIHETPNPFTKPFVRSGFREGADRSPAEYRLYFDRGSQPERNSLRTKEMRAPGFRKDLVIS